MAAPIELELIIAVADCSLHKSLGIKGKEESFIERCNAFFAKVV